jgi:hypothetical protein
LRNLFIYFPRNFLYYERDSVTRFFASGFFHESVSPSPRVFHWDCFFRKFAEIFASQVAPPASATPVANLPPVSLILAAILPPVSLTSSYKTSIYQTSSYRTSRILQNVRDTKRPVTKRPVTEHLGYKTSRTQNARSLLAIYGS